MHRGVRVSLALLFLSLLTAACGGAGEGGRYGSFSKDARSAEACSLEEGQVACDVGACDADCTVIVLVGGHPFKTVDVCPDPHEDPVVVFKAKEIPAGFDVVCQGGDGDPVVLGRGLGLDSGETAISGGKTEDGGTTSGSGGDVIIPGDPGAGSSGGGTSGGSSGEGATGGSTGTTTGGSNGTTGGTTTGGTTGGINISPGLISNLLGPIEMDPLSLKADFKKLFGKTDVRWSVDQKPEDIQELYLWSSNLNRDLQEADVCGKGAKSGFLIVDPVTGQNYNAGSPNANAVQDLLEGKSCNNTDGDASNDCDGVESGKYSACRMDLKKNGQWLTKGSFSTVGSGKDETGRFVLVAKLKNGQVLKYEKFLPIPAAEFVGPTVTYAEADGKPMIRAHFHYRNVDPRTNVAAVSNQETCAANVAIPATGEGDYDGLCSLKPANDIVLVARGMSYTSSISYKLNLGDPTATLKSTAPATLLAPGKYDFYYTISRPWTLTSPDTGESSSGVLQSSRVVGKIHLKRMNPDFLVNPKNNPLLAEVASQGAADSDHFAGIDVNHKAYEFHITVEEMDGSKTFDNLAQMGVHFPSEMKASQIGQAVCYFTVHTDPAQDWGCGNDCPDHTFVSGLTANVLVQVRNLKSFEASCPGAKTELTANGGPASMPGADDPKSYDMQTYVMKITGGDATGGTGWDDKKHTVKCTFKGVSIDGSDSQSVTIEDTCTAPND